MSLDDDGQVSFRWKDYRASGRTGDGDGRYVIDAAGNTVAAPRGATDAFLAPWHVERGQLFVRRRCAAVPGLDVERLCRAIELTRFPVPEDRDHAGAETEAGLVRAADLIGQLADPAYPRKLEQSARKLGRLYPHERAEVSMAGSYSTDLRERVLAAVEAGATPGAAARRFAVGRSTAYRWATAARVEGRRAAKRMGGGPKPRITGEVEAALLDLLGEANHLTLAECRDRLAERTGVRVHPWTVGRALRRCGWT